MASGKENVFVERYLTPLSVLLAAIIIGGALLLSDGVSRPRGGETGVEQAAPMQEIAEDLDLDTGRIEDLLKQNQARYQAAIDADREEGSSFGIQGTPGTIYGKTLIPGAYPLEDVVGVINGKPLEEAEGAPPAVVDVARVKIEGNPTIGRADASVMAVWFDFQCSFCKRFDAETLAELEKTLVAEGKLRIVYKDFQFLGPASNEAALYSRAVWEAHPDRWHEWFKRMLAE